MRRPLSSTSVELTPRPRSEMRGGAGGEAVAEGRRDRALAVGGERLQHFGDRLLAGLLDVLARDDLDRRRGLGVGPLDVRAGDLDAFERLSRSARTPSGPRSAIRRHRRPSAPCRASSSSTLKFPPVKKFDRRSIDPGLAARHVPILWTAHDTLKRRVNELSCAAARRFRQGMHLSLRRGLTAYRRFGAAEPGKHRANSGVRSLSPGAAERCTFAFVARSGVYTTTLASRNTCRPFVATTRACRRARATPDARAQATQPQPMNAWRRSTSSRTFAPTGNVTLVATCPKGSPVRIGVRVAARTRASDRRKRVAAVERRLALAAHGTQHDRLLRVENAGLMKLQQIALDPIRMLVDVLDEQDAALDARPVRRRRAAR